MSFLHDKRHLSKILHSEIVISKGIRVYLGFQWSGVNFRQIWHEKNIAVSNYVFHFISYIYFALRLFVFDPVQLRIQIMGSQLTGIYAQHSFEHFLVVLLTFSPL